MPFVFKRLAFFMSIAAGLAADKQTAFKPPAAAEFAHRQTNNQVTLGAEPYLTGKQSEGSLRQAAVIASWN